MATEVGELLSLSLTSYPGLDERTPDTVRTMDWPPEATARQRRDRQLDRGRGVDYRRLPC